MHVFVTGATGWVGSAIVPELLANGHTVLGLARSGDSARKLREVGAEALMGTLEDLDIFRQGARQCEAIIHAGFIHDFADYAGSAAKDKRAIEAMGEVLRGTTKPLVVTSGSLAKTDAKQSRVTEKSEAGPHFPRLPTESATLKLAENGVNAMILRLAPSVHGQGDGGFVHRLVELAKEKGYVAYVGDGQNRWPAVHRKDAAVLYRLAIESPAGKVLQGFHDEALRFKVIVEAIGKRLALEVRSIPAAEAEAYYGWLTFFVTMDAEASSQWTRKTFHWQPKEMGLIEDITINY